MKITVITGSPRKKGNTFAMVDALRQRLWLRNFINMTQLNTGA